MQDEQTQVCGLVVIENYTGFGLVHARHFDQKAAKLFTSVIQVFLLVTCYMRLMRSAGTCDGGRYVGRLKAGKVTD